ncbi:Wzz/FepE/Etk N-terminal domain-containing protein [Vibrio owensii]|uniref:Wzz/FepE/Etk N-terminal domain-containing protein n=1 Tax=Vibrio owensii TaxID=696485 RepID=UPI003DA07810
MENPQKELLTNYSSYPPQPHSTDDEIDLRQLFKVLWQGKWIIIATTFVFAVSSVIYALSLPNIYKADALLAPTESSNNGGLSKMAGQLGGLAAIAGVNLGESASSQTTLAVQIMQSRQFIDAFVKKHELTIPLMAVEGWDLTTNKLIFNEELYDEENDKWLREPRGLKTVQPTAQEEFKIFYNNIIAISEDKESGLYTLSVKHYSPFIAQQWVGWLISDINDVMRKRAISEASRNLEYLNNQLDKTAVSEMQATFYKLIEEQTKRLMLAEAQEEFVFKTIDPPVVPEEKYSPNRSIICIIGTILGSVFGIVLVLIWYVFRGSKY